MAEVAEWGQKIAGELEEVALDAKLEPSLPGKPKIYLLTYRVQRPLFAWVKPDPEKFVQEVRETLKREVGLLGEDFIVHWYKYDENNEIFQIQVERKPPELRPAFGVITTIAICAAIIAGVAFTYFGVKLIAEKAEKIVVVIKESAEALTKILKALKEFALVAGPLTITAMLIYFVGKAKLKGG